jgi:hypothetical protein
VSGCDHFAQRWLLETGAFFQFDKFDTADLSFVAIVVNVLVDFGLLELGRAVALGFGFEVAFF